jgi:transposase InsO family protein
LVKDGKLFKRNGNRPPLLVIFEPDRKLSILRQAHEEMGHRGVQAVYEILRHRFFWPHLRADVHHHVKSCHECQVRSLKKTEIPLTISTPTKLFSKIYVDIMHMPTSVDKKVCIVAARDDLSGTCEAKALSNKTADELRIFFWEQIFCRYGAPEHVITDNGSEIKGVFAALLKRLKIPQIRITPYNHHANGVVERGHFVLRESILKSCQTTGTPISRWPEKLAEAVFADRITISRVTGFSPYQLLHGTDPVLPLDLVEATFIAEGFHPKMTTSDLIVLRMRQLSKHPDDIARAARILKKARFNSKEQFERRFIHRLSRDTYQKGELVLVRNTQIEVSHNRKHKVRYLGPFTISSQSDNGYYWLKEMDGALYKHKIAPSRLLPYITRQHAFMKDNAQGRVNGLETDTPGLSDSSSDESSDA